VYKLLTKIYGKKIQAKYKKRTRHLQQIDPDYYKEACSYDLFLLKKK